MNLLQMPDMLMEKQESMSIFSLIGFLYLPTAMNSLSNNIILRTDLVSMLHVNNYDLECFIDHFTVVCSVTWPLNGSEAGGELVLIQTSLLL